MGNSPQRKPRTAILAEANETWQSIIHALCGNLAAGRTNGLLDALRDAEIVDGGFQFVTPHRALQSDQAPDARFVVFRARSIEFRLGLSYKEDPSEGHVLIDSHAINGEWDNASGKYRDHVPADLVSAYPELSPLDLDDLSDDAWVFLEDVSIALQTARRNALLDSLVGATITGAEPTLHPMETANLTLSDGRKLLVNISHVS